MKRDQLKIGDSFLFHTEPKNELERIVPYGIQQFTESEYNHAARYLGNGICMGALAEGYTKQTLEEAISSCDRVDVYRYHAYRDEYTPEQQKKLVDYALSLEGTPYDFLDIICLAGLMQINNTTWEAMLLSKGFEWVLDNFGSAVTRFIQKMKIIEKSSLLKEGVLMCSQADILVDIKGAGVNIRILNDDARKEYYRNAGDIMTRYRQPMKGELLDPFIDYFVVPRDIAESPDKDFIDTLEI
jgi:hypothetical protein